MHDFKRFPELTDGQMKLYYWDSPHKQITEGFSATVVKVHDGDTVTLRCDFRDFDFPLRLLDLAAPELDEPGGPESQSWLEEQLLGKEVLIELDPFARVEKWGRLLGLIILDGVDISQESVRQGHGLSWEGRDRGSIPDFEKVLKRFEIG